jgi:hypothetical protein
VPAKQVLHCYRAILLILSGALIINVHPALNITRRTYRCPVGKQIAMAERRAVVMDLRRQGHSFAVIAHQVGVSAPTAYRDVVEGIAEIVREPAPRAIC